MSLASLALLHPVAQCLVILFGGLVALALALVLALVAWLVLR